MKFPIVTVSLDAEPDSPHQYKVYVYDDVGNQFAFCNADLRTEEEAIEWGKGQLDLWRKNAGGKV